MPIYRSKKSCRRNQAAGVLRRTETNKGFIGPAIVLVETANGKERVNLAQIRRMAGRKKPPEENVRTMGRFLAKRGIKPEEIKLAELLPKQKYAAFLTAWGKKYA